MLPYNKKLVSIDNKRYQQIFQKELIYEHFDESSIDFLANLWYIYKASLCILVKNTDIRAENII
jgi:hypothetical protein